MQTGPSGLYRSTAQISALTAAARLLGFARWVVFGLTVGATYLGNTYQTANLVPNILYELAAGGVLSAVFVPTFVDAMRQGRDRAGEVASTLLNLALLVSIPVVVGGMLLGRPIMRAFTSGVPDPAIREQQIEIGAWFLLFFLPQVPLYLSGMVARAVAHANDRFALAAASPAFSSIIVIVTYVVFWALGPGATVATVTDAQRWVLAVGTTAGIVAWAAAQYVPAIRSGVRWRPVVRLRDPAVRRALRSSVDGVWFYAITQAGMIATLVLANRVEGGVVAWQLAFAFYEVPNAVAGFPFAVALQPSMARAYLDGDEPAFGRLVSRGWRGSLVVLAPAAAVLAVLALPGARAAAGVAARAAPELVGATLLPLAVGLPAYALQQTLVRAMYARNATVRPIVMNAVTVGAFVGVAVAVVVSGGGDGTAVLAWIGGAHAAGQWIGLAAGALLLARTATGWRPGGDGLFLAGSTLRAALVGAVAFAGVVLARAAGDGAGLVAGGAAAGLAALLVSFRLPEVRQMLSGLRSGTS